MKTAKTANRPMICPVCGGPIQEGQDHKNTVYDVRDSIPLSAQAHYPACYLKQHPRPRLPVVTQPQLFATALMVLLFVLVGLLHPAPANAAPSMGASCASIAYFQPDGGDDLYGFGTFTYPWKTRYRTESAGKACIIELDEDHERIGRVLRRGGMGRWGWIYSR